MLLPLIDGSPGPVTTESVTVALSAGSTNGNNLYQWQWMF